MAGQRQRDPAINLFLVFHNLDEMANGEDHAANRRRVLECAGATNLSETKTAQRRRLNIRLAIGAADLAYDQGLFGFLVSHNSVPYEAAACSPFWPSRRAMISVTLRPRRCATMRGLCWFFSASNTARTML